MEYKKYNYLENTLQEINKSFIALENKEIGKNAAVLNYIVSNVIKTMQKDQLFKELYQNIYSGGSYFCGLKVGKPDEYDLDLLFRIPVLCNATIINSDVDGFVHVELQNMLEFFRQKDLASKYPRLQQNLLNAEDFLSTDNVIKWMASLINKALNNFKVDGQYSPAKFYIPSHGTHYVTFRRQGPAFTLDVYFDDIFTTSESHLLSVDLVPCFVFKDRVWPVSPYRPNPSYKKNEFFVVPKSVPDYLKNELDREIDSYWRLSFQEQENEIIERSQHLKPALRLIKKLRDVWNHKRISSYYIKTIFLWEIERSNIYWNKSLSYVFMTMIIIYQKYIENGCIPYYWNDNLNLVSGSNSDYLFNTSSFLKKLIKDVERNPGSPNCIRKYFDGPRKTRLECDYDFESAETLEMKSEDRPNSFCTVL